MVVPSSLVVFVLIVSLKTPAPFCLGCIDRRRISLSLDIYVVRILCSFLSSWRLPSWAAYFSISLR